MVKTPQKKGYTLKKSDGIGANKSKMVWKKFSPRTHLKVPSQFSGIIVAHQNDLENLKAEEKLQHPQHPNWIEIFDAHSERSR